MQCNPNKKGDDAPFGRRRDWSTAQVRKFFAVISRPEIAQIVVDVARIDAVPGAIVVNVLE